LIFLNQFNYRANGWFGAPKGLISRQKTKYGYKFDMRKLSLSYFFAALGFMGAAGIHRFYLGKPVTGLLYLFTGGLFGIGTVIDLIRMPTLVNLSNYQMLLERNATQHAFRHNTEPVITNSERDILQCAQRNGGRVTIQRVALDTGLSLAKAKAELDKLKAGAFCTLDIDIDGNDVYLFKGLDAQSPLFD